MVVDTTEKILFLGESIGFWLQTGAICLSAIFAGWQLSALRKEREDELKNRKQLDLQWKQRATVDAVISDKRDERLISSRIKYGEMKKGKENFDQLAMQPIINNQEKNQAILDILNNYEFMASGIREGAFDEDIYKRMKCSLIQNDWTVLEIYILALRKAEERPKLFIEFEWLAKKWIKEG